MANHDIQDELELFRETAAGNEQAFGRLFAIYARLLYPFLYRIVKSPLMAEEFIQETMLRVWLHRDKLPELEHPRAWVYRVAANLAFSHLQKEMTAAKVNQHISRAAHDESPDMNEYVSLKNLRVCIRQAVAQLPQQRKIIFQLSREKGLSRAEIAGKLNISEKTVKNAMNASLRFIRDYLQRAGYLLPIFYIVFFRK